MFFTVQARDVNFATFERVQAPDPINMPLVWSNGSVE